MTTTTDRQAYVDSFEQEEKSARIDLWGGPNADKNRPMTARRPCSCGCDEREGPIVGYVSGSDQYGYGITIFAPDEETYDRFRAIFGGDA